MQAMQFVALVRGGLGVASLAWRRSSLNPAMDAVSAKTPAKPVKSPDVDPSAAGASGLLLP
jgi:hypothetical protein